MKTLLLSSIAAVTLLASPAAAQQSALATWQPDEAALRGHVKFLASDLLKGREAGTREYDIAADYVATQYEALGLKPAGDALPGGTSYSQKVPLVLTRPANEGAFAVVRGGQAVPLVFGTDYLPGSTPLEAATARDAPMVFAGFGVVAPGFKRDDYAGLDVRGKIVVLLSGAPSTFPTEERAHYGNGVTKRVEAARRGAVGVITVDTPTRERVLPFARRVTNWRSLGATWANASGAPYFPGGTAPGVGTISLAGAEKLFAGVPGGAAAVMAAAEGPTSDPRRTAMGSNARIAFTTEISRADSSNVAGMIEGSDPALKNEVIVLSGHLDHVGVGVPIAGDAIYNGAMDNAVGIASMLEVAHGFKHLKLKPKRSILFLAVTAEEKGLVGADYFAQNPTVAKSRLVANVNLDMPVITYDFRDVVAFGAERSTIGETVRGAGAPLGIALVPDPQPEQGIFTRSDHYRFVQQGIPSVFLVTGPGGTGAAANAAFNKDHYHKPSDAPNLPIRWDAGARFVALNLAIARELADAPARPAWKRGDFFGTLYGGFGAR